MSYVDLFRNLSTVDPLGLITLFFLGFFRLAPIINQAPFLGAKVAPVIVRAGLMIALSLVYLPLIATHATHTLGFNWAFIGYSMKELAIGLVIGYLISVPFLVIESSGIIIDFMRGASTLTAQDPTTQMQSSSIGIMFNYVLIFLFFQVNGPFVFFDAMAKSFEFLPVDGGLSPLLFNMQAPVWQLLTNVLAKILALALQMAAPAIVAVLMAEMFLGIANRLAPQVQIAFLGMALKSLLGMGLLWAGWFFILRQVGDFALDWIKIMEKIIYSMSAYKIG
ncbi:MAG: hypothetical protein SP1CHLAM54_13140 [Chlamydiia bacterium]|nr:hypothetical protein [Chlamydiia bacterium]MCH9616210.1 hypothetical protein [Chlamydiia bacterium]MCH9629804.1 hypothetical protein [Chlamydiia bacterium]